MMDAKRVLQDAAAYEIPLTESAAETLCAYGRALVKANEFVNLTAITEPRDVEIKHILDSLLVTKCDELAGSVADVGTGAGFPGSVLKTARRDLSLTLIDATGKKLNFIRETCASIGVELKTVHGRAEELSRGPLRETFDTVTARAVANLAALLEYCLPLVKVGGHFIAMKGPDADEELALARNAMNLLGGEHLRTDRYTLPDGSERAVMVFKKISQTPTKYPRTGKNITKKPL